MATDRRGRLSCLGVAVAALALVGGSLLWLFHDDLLHPFGDTRACEGSDAPLPQVIAPGGTPLPADAADIHYVTEHGRAQVSFLSDQVPDFLHRAGIVPADGSLFDKSYGYAYAMGPDEAELPEGLCGPAFRGPAWTYGGPGVEILVERSSLGFDAFRAPARVIATFDVGRAG